MTDYPETLSRHRRIGILRYLEMAPHYSSNSSILADVLHGLGLTSTHDQVVTELTWLKEQGYLLIEDLGGIVVATATPRGVEIATGAATHPGIQRPRPRAGR